MGDDLLVSVGWADRHELGSGSIHGHEDGIVEQHQGDRIAVLNGRNGNIARVGSVGPHVPEMTKCMAHSLSGLSMISLVEA